MNRRDFVELAGLGIAGACLPGCVTQRPWESSGPAAVPRIVDDIPSRKGRRIRSRRKLNIACIGCGGKGGSDVASVADENIVALCDVDANRARAAFKKFPGARRYRDFRHMLIEMDEQIDAVTVSTPDHMHFPAAMMAITMGKHVFVQKPIAHTVAEARRLTEAARAHDVVTIMGNQGHANEGTRLLREWVEAGAIGDVHEIHIWTNRPVWPQGMRGRPLERMAPPDSLDWNRWVGVAPMRPYHSAYLPFNWRGWWDFGCGALGDMGCHMIDASFWALQLGAPTTIDAEVSGFSNEVAPEWARATFEFPARGAMPPVTLRWFSGGELPPRPEDLEPERKMPKAGQLLLGDKGTIMDTSDYCSSPRLIPEASMKAFERPEKTIPRVLGGNHYREWLEACRGGELPGSNFDHAGPLTEVCMLGNIAIRLGRKLRWNAADMTFVGDSEATTLVHKQYRRF